MYAVLFPNGLKFTQLPYKQEWAEAKAKLDRITQEGYETEIQKLGGKPILDHLVATHQAYGQSLGITTETQDSSVSLRAPLIAFTKYLRAYVVAVTTHTDPDDDASGDLADALLAPLHEWKTYVAVAEPEPTQQPSPGPGPTPGAAPGQGSTPAPTDNPTTGQA